MISGSIKGLHRCTPRNKQKMSGNLCTYFTKTLRTTGGIIQQVLTVACDFSSFGEKRFTNEKIFYYCPFGKKDEMKGLKTGVSTYCEGTAYGVTLPISDKTIQNVVLSKPMVCLCGVHMGLITDAGGLPIFEYKLNSLGTQSHCACTPVMPEPVSSESIDPSHIFYCGQLDATALGGLCKTNAPYDFYPGNTDITKPLPVFFYTDVAQENKVSGTVQLSPPILGTWRDEPTPMGTFVHEGTTYRYAISRS